MMNCEGYKKQSRSVNFEVTVLQMTKAVNKPASRENIPSLIGIRTAPFKGTLLFFPYLFVRLTNFCNLLRVFFLL